MGGVLELKMGGVLEFLEIMGLPKIGRLSLK